MHFLSVYIVTVDPVLPSGLIVHTDTHVVAAQYSTNLPQDLKVAQLL